MVKWVVLDGILVGLDKVADSLVELEVGVCDFRNRGVLGIGDVDAGGAHFAVIAFEVDTGVGVDGTYTGDGGGVFYG